MGIEKIVSGGQTGADRAALDFAIARKIPHGGWCPRGRIAEDGKIPERYQLLETPEAQSQQRTEWNVRDSDGTVIFSINERLGGGSRETLEFATRLNRPCLHLFRDGKGKTAAETLGQFIASNKIAVLNVAGPRESEEPGIGRFVSETLEGWMFGGVND